MGVHETEYLLREGKPRIAFRRSAGRGPAIVWCGGFRSDMAGEKASALHLWAESEGRAFFRFDYAGHGESAGAFTEGVISSWLGDALAVIDQAGGQTVLVGSSMGGWIALLAALRRPVKALLLLAPAPDFTERLMLPKFSPEARRKLAEEGQLTIPSAYAPDDPTIVTRALIEDGRNHLLLDGPIAFAGPVRIIHGQADPDVPWRQSLTLAEKLESADVEIHLRKDGDHRLSRPHDIAFMVATLAELVSGL
jgi:pimeloyl-ACP methyl ester carboxylesterase